MQLKPAYDFNSYFLIILLLLCMWSVRKARMGARFIEDSAEKNYRPQVVTYCGSFSPLTKTWSNPQVTQAQVTGEYVRHTS